MIKTFLKNKKAFISIFTLLFVLIFLFISFSYQNHNINDFLIINNLNTQNEIEKNNLIKIIENTLTSEDTNLTTVKINVNRNILEYSKNKEITIYNKINKQEENLSLESLNKISQVIIIRPSKNTVVKTYIITNGINKNKTIRLNNNLRKYKVYFDFPENFSITKVVVIE